MFSKRESILAPALQSATVADAVRPGIISCPADTSALKVARMMATHHVHCIFVMHSGYDESTGPYVWGIISDLDLMQAALRGDHAASAGSLASEPMITVKPEMPLVDACALMVEYKVNHLVVVEPGTLRPIGVLSTTDVADLMAWGES